MSEVERMVWENAERRRFAEELRWEISMQEANARMEARREKELKMWQRWRRVALMGAQVHLGASAVMALMGLPVAAAMGAIATAFYYSCAWMFGRMCDGRKSV